MGGFVAAAQPIVDLLRQRARPYLFSNSLAPPVAAGALKALEIAMRADDRRARLQAHTKRFRAGLERGWLQDPSWRDADHSRHARRGAACAGSRQGARSARRLRRGFFFPVVPKGQARIRTQMSAALTRRGHVGMRASAGLHATPGVASWKSSELPPEAAR